MVAVVSDRLRPDGAHGLGQGRPAECGSRRTIPDLDFAGGTVVHVTSGVSALVCALYLGQAPRISAGSDAAAQRGAKLHRRVPAVGWLVRIQRGQRARPPAAWPPALLSRRISPPPPRRSAGPRPSGSERQAQRAGRDLRRGRRSGRNHSGRRVCSADVRLLIGFIAGVFCYFMVAKVKAQVRLRRFARRVRRARRGRNARRDPDRRLRFQRGESRFSRMLKGGGCLRDGSKAMAISCSTSSSASRLHGFWQSLARSLS